MRKIIYGILCSFGLLTNAMSSEIPKAIKVEIKKGPAGYQMLRGGQPYFIKGAGGSSYFSRLAVYGGNSVRTWGTEKAKSVLDSAEKNGLTVMLGLNVMPERHGFNYDDSVAVQKQFERVKADVLKYKDHPALLTWGIGNELNLFYKNTKVWKAVNDIAKMIKDIDPNHLVTTVLAGANKQEIEYIKKDVTAIDLLAINTYGELVDLPKKLEDAGWDGAYIVTEWGPTGHWEGLQTTWKAPIEESSSEKAAVYQMRYNYGIDRDKANCLGSYVFLWGQKQERTPTWYGLFTANGEESEVVDVMHFLWKGVFPKNKAPHIYALMLNQLKANQNVYVKAGANCTAEAVATDPENDKLNYQWELLPEPTKVAEGGDYEDKPIAIEMNHQITGVGKIKFTSPATSGAYRLFVYINDGKNKVATANIPFYVQKK